MKSIASLTIAASIFGVCSWAHAQEPRTVEPGRQDTTGQDGVRKATPSQVSVIHKASDLIGKNVVNPEGKTLGEIKNLAIDGEQGRIAYAILSFGGFLGIGNKLFAIPWGALRIGPGGDNFVLNVDKAKLEKAPGFDNDKWPDLTNRQVAGELHTYYGITPYWEDANWKGVIQPGRGDVRHPADASRHDGTGMGMGKDGKQYNPQSVETVTGKVEDVNRNSPVEGMPQPMEFTLKTPANEILKVHVGPAAYLQGQNFDIRANDQVEVKGSKVMTDGKQCIIASEIKKDGRTLKLRDERGNPAWTTDRDGDLRREKADPAHRDR